MHFWRHFSRKLKDHFVPSERNVYRPHILRKPWLIFFVTMVLTAQAVFLLDIVARQSAFDFVAAVLPGEVIALTNQERSTNSAGTLAENALLTQAAQAKANDMAAKGYFAHVSPDGTVPWVWVSDAGYEYQYAGENLAVRFTDSTSVVNAWMASPTHRANIVKPVYTEIGVGVAQGEFQGEPATFVVQYFGTPRAAASVAVVSTPANKAAVATVPTNPQVEGAATVAAPQEEPVSPVIEQTPTPAVSHTETPWNSVARALLNTETRPTSAVLWILGAVAALMVLGLALTFFVHIQIQPTEMLMGGAVVAMIAIAFLILNTQSSLLPQEKQTAAVFGSMPTQGGFIDASAAVTAATH